MTVSVCMNCGKIFKKTKPHYALDYLEWCSHECRDEFKQRAVNGDLIKWKVLANVK